MYKYACKFDDKIIFYFDELGNKYVATGGNLAWRIKNPGLIHNRSRASIQNKPIGCCDGIAIFAEPEHGFQALSDWLKSKTNYTLKTIAKHYCSKDVANTSTRLAEAVGISLTQKIGTLSKEELEKLVMAISKLCGYQNVGDEKFVLLPKIMAKIENGDNKDAYLVGSEMHLDAAEAKRLRIFTFGGWSFISSEKCHPDSHNYISAKDFIPALGSPNLRDFALELYHGDKKGISHE